MMLVYHQLRHSPGVTSVSPYRAYFLLCQLSRYSILFKGNAIKIRSQNRAEEPGIIPPPLPDQPVPVFQRDGIPWQYWFCIAIFRGVDLPHTASNPLLEQPGLFLLKLRQDMTIIIKPSCHRIAAEHHEFPDVSGIGRLVVSHEDLTRSLSHDFDLASRMRHHKPSPFRKT